ncbi:hypothetical protein AX16_010052 [Volvariella volvacea WC 439]|nr:hypothetical protein AX16_010052 [Volvariella volvacea WC 439]
MDYIPSDFGYFFYHGAPGDKLGADVRFKLKRRIATGFCATTWVAKDHVLDRFVAVSILSCSLSNFNLHSRSYEFDIYKKLDKGAAENNCSMLVDYIVLRGVDDSRAERVQLSKEDNEVSLRAVNIVVRDVLKALSYLHKHGVVYRGEWIFTFRGLNAPSYAYAAADVKMGYSRPIQDLESEVLRVRPEWEAHDLPQPSNEGLHNKRFILSNFGGSTECEKQAPETFLSDEWKKAVDIWALRPMAYSLLTLDNLLLAEASSEFLRLLEEEPHTICVCLRDDPLKVVLGVLVLGTTEYVTYQMLLY